MAAGAQTNTTTRSNPTVQARSPPLGGLGGLGFPGFDGTLGSTPDPSSLNQFMQNPAVSQMMQSLLSNPQYMNQVLLHSAIPGLVLCQVSYHPVHVACRFLVSTPRCKT